MGEGLFPEADRTKKTAAQAREAKPVEVDGEWGDNESVTDLIAKKREDQRETFSASRDEDGPP